MSQLCQRESDGCQAVLLSRHLGGADSFAIQCLVIDHSHDHLDELRAHLADFVTAYNFAKRLKPLKGLTPYQYICKVWTEEPERFTLNPLQQMPGLNI